MTGPEDIDRNTDIILALCRREEVEFSSNECLMYLIN